MEFGKFPLISNYVDLTLDSSAVFQDNEGQFHIISYVTALGHALIDRELYLPEDWCADALRRQAAHIPETVAFRTKPELGQRMIQRAQAAGLPIGWVVADTVYGHSPDLRSFLEEQGFSYAASRPLHRSGLCADPQRPAAQ